MKVSELVKALQGLDQDAVVKISVIDIGETQADKDGAVWRTAGRNVATVEGMDLRQPLSPEAEEFLKGQHRENIVLLEE